MVLILGNKGSTGRRYEAILKNIGVDCVGVDKDDILPENNDTIDRVIIATPTQLHREHFVRAIDKYTSVKNMLIEKPITKNIAELNRIKNLAKQFSADISMVNNWSFTSPWGMPWVPGKCEVEYNFYNAGKDNDLWDMIQLVYLSKKESDFGFKFESPVFKARICGESISLADIERSYCSMICSWLTNKFMWNIDDAISATEKVLKCLKL